MSTCLGRQTTAPSVDALYEQLTLEDLPGSMRRVADIVGLAPTVQLLKEFGGLEVYIPRRPERLRPDHWLLKMMGEEGAARLCLRFNGDMLKVPMGTSAIRAARDRAVRRRYSQGESAPALARDFGMALREIERVVSGVHREASTGA